MSPLAVVEIAQLREQVAAAAVETSFDRSVERVDDATSGHVPKRQAEQEVLRAAVDFEAFYVTRPCPRTYGGCPTSLRLIRTSGASMSARFIASAIISAPAPSGARGSPARR
jgi:hypothetical protein